ncbi:helix-turn-helix transcriptional regulator [Pseudobdellovibrio sp. HCB154]|uniref:helix-turn-helix transcriptional regulator n=1 Tax=Pseudobdellovibrio sp. HCB154 TaxID=3386277 RepID=UPI0039170AFE
MSTKKWYGIEDLEKRLGPFTMAMLLRSFRTREEISQVDFAKKLKISKANLCDIEKGRKLVSLERAAKFAKLLKDSELLYVKVALDDQLRAANLRYEVFIKKAA